jgi:5'-nucleotidase/UDP-sugar diphosphatase
VVVNDPISMAASEIAAAKEGNPTAAIVLTHIGDEGNEVLAGAVSELGADAIIGGHTHDPLPEYCAESYPDCDDVGCRVPAQPTGGSFLGRIDIDFDKGKGNKMTSRTVPLRADTPKDPEVREFIDRALELDRNLHPENYVVEGYLSSDLESSRSEQSTLGAFTTDAMLREAKEAGHASARIALINSGAMRDDIIPNSKGEVLSGQVKRVFKYDNQLATVKVKGSDLQKILEKSEGLPSGDGMYLQYAGVPESIDGDKMYEVVTIDYLVKYDHTYFPKGTKYKPIGAKIRRAFVDQLAKLEMVAGGRR